MNIQSWVGLILIAFGIIAMVVPVLPFGTKAETVSIGPLKAEIETEREFRLPWETGFVSTAAGVVLLVAGTRRRRTSRLAD